MNFLPQTAKTQCLTLLALVAGSVWAGQPRIVDIGPSHRTIAWTEERTWPDGQVLTENHGYVALATGMNHLEDGVWLESRTDIELQAVGAAALHGQHQCYFSQNLNTAGATVLILPDGQRMNWSVLALAYVDVATGVTKVIGRIRDSAGELHPPNQIIYPDAFEGMGVLADVRLTYTLAGLEQDIIFRPSEKDQAGQPVGLAALPDPADFGMNPETVQLETWTVFVDSPVPLGLERGAAMQPAVAPGSTAEGDTAILDFGSMQIGAGQAFPMPSADPADAVPVRKLWVQETDGTQYLIESLPFSTIQKYLAPQKKTASSQVRPPASLQPRPAHWIRRAFPPTPARLAKRAQKPMRLALLPEPARGLVVDFNINGSYTNFVFAGDWTYGIIGPVYLTGSNNLIESGSVLKFQKNAGATIAVQGTLVGKTDAWRPSVLTAIDDASVGESLGGSSPSGVYATIALDFSSTNSVAALQNLRIAYAAKAVRFNGYPGHELRHVQIYNCGTAVDSVGADYALRNVLLWNVTNATTGSGTGRWEHATFDQVTNLTSGVSVCLTNCLLTGVVNTNGLTGQGNTVLTSSNGVCNVVGGGRHYLSDHSAYRDMGTPNINATLAGELKIRTTFAPLVLANLSVDTTLSPVAGRDVDTPDLGFHYPSLDYWASGVTVNSNVTLCLSNGVAVGVDYAASSWGFILKSARVISEGNPMASNRLIRAHMAQELSGGNPATRAIFYDGASGDATCEVRLRWTETAQLVADGYLVYSGTKSRAFEWSHCSLYNPSVVIYTSGGNTLDCGMTNCLSDRGGVQFGFSSPSSAATAHVRNCLFRPGSLYLVANAVNSWTVRDNLFERCIVNSAYGAAVSNSYNAFYLATNQLSASGTNYTLTNLVYQAGPLGPYYQPTNSPLLNAGSTNASSVGLFFYTTTTNQVLETNSIIDIGIHFIAVNGSGQPLDSDGDGIPNYIENFNGNDNLDSGETRWDDANDPGLWVRIWRPGTGMQLP